MIDHVTRLGHAYTSGNWIVNEGNERAFIDQWVAVAEWCLEHYPGAAHFFRLIQDQADSRHFISFGEWETQEAITVSRSRAEFLRLFRQCQTLCESFTGSDYTVALALPDRGAVAAG